MMRMAASWVGWSFFYIGGCFFELFVIFVSVIAASTALEWNSREGNLEEDVLHDIGGVLRWNLKGVLLKETRRSPGLFREDGGGSHFACLSIRARRTPLDWRRRRPGFTATRIWEWVGAQGLAVDEGGRPVDEFLFCRPINFPATAVVASLTRITCRGLPY